MREITNGYWCHSDVNVVSALMSPNHVIHGGDIDPNHTLQPIELAYSYVKWVPPRKKRPHSTVPGMVHSIEAEEGELVPVVMFALKPFRGGFGLHQYKFQLWHRGGLYADTRHYAGTHRRLLEEVRAQLARAKEERGREMQARREGASYILEDCEDTGGAKDESDTRRAPRVVRA